MNGSRTTACRPHSLHLRIDPLPRFLFGVRARERGRGLAVRDVHDDGDDDDDDDDDDDGGGGGG